MRRSSVAELLLFRCVKIRLVFQTADQLVVGFVGDYTGELGSIVIHQANVLGDHVIDFPLIADQMGFVIDRVLFALARDDLAADIGKTAVDALIGVEDLFIGIGLDDTGIGAFEDFG